MCLGLPYNPPLLTTSISGDLGVNCYFHSQGGNSAFCSFISAQGHSSLSSLGTESRNNNSPGTPALRSLKQRMMKQETLGNGDNQAICIHQYPRYEPKLPRSEILFEEEEQPYLALSCPGTWLSCNPIHPSGGSNQPWCLRFFKSS